MAPALRRQGLSHQQIQWTLTALWHRPTISAAPPLTPPSAAAALVGRLGSASLGAVGASTILHNFSGFLFSFLMVVTTPRVARAVANADMAEVGTMQDALLCFIVCLLYVILFPCLCHEQLNWHLMLAPVL